MQVNRYDGGWKKQWYGAGLFAEASEEVTLDVVKELEKKKFLSNVERSGLLSKAEDFGFTLSSIEKLGLLSKAEQFGLLSLLEKTAGASPAVLASISLPLLLAALAVVVLVPDDSTTLIVVQTVAAVVLSVVGAGLFIGSLVIEGLQEE